MMAKRLTLLAFLLVPMVLSGCSLQQKSPSKGVSLRISSRALQSQKGLVPESQIFGTKSFYLVSISGPGLLKASPQGLPCISIARDSSRIFEVEDGPEQVLDLEVLSGPDRLIELYTFSVPEPLLPFLVQGSGAWPFFSGYQGRFPSFQRVAQARIPDLSEDQTVLLERSEKVPMACAIEGGEREPEVPGMPEPVYQDEVLQISNFRPWWGQRPDGSPEPIRVWGSPPSVADFPFYLRMSGEVKNLSNGTLDAVSGALTLNEYPGVEVSNKSSPLSLNPGEQRHYQAVSSVYFPGSAVPQPSPGEILHFEYQFKYLNSPILVATRTFQAFNFLDGGAKSPGEENSAEGDSTLSTAVPVTGVASPDSYSGPKVPIDLQFLGEPAPVQVSPPERVPGYENLFKVVLTASGPSILKPLHSGSVFSSDPLVQIEVIKEFQSGNTEESMCPVNDGVSESAVDQVLVSGQSCSIYFAQLTNQESNSERILIDLEVASIGNEGGRPKFGIVQANLGEVAPMDTNLLPKRAIVPFGGGNGSQEFMQVATYHFNLNDPSYALGEVVPNGDANSRVYAAKMETLHGAWATPGVHDYGSGIQIDVPRMAGGEPVRRVTFLYASSTSIQRQEVIFVPMSEVSIDFEAIIAPLGGSPSTDAFFDIYHGPGQGDHMSLTAVYAKTPYGRFSLSEEWDRLSADRSFTLPIGSCEWVSGLINLTGLDGVQTFNFGFSLQNANGCR